MIFYRIFNLSLKKSVNRNQQCKAKIQTKWYHQTVFYQQQYSDSTSTYGLKAWDFHRHLCNHKALEMNFEFILDLNTKSSREALNKTSLPKFFVHMLNDCHLFLLLSLRKDCLFWVRAAGNWSAQLQTAKQASQSSHTTDWKQYNAVCYP